MLTEKQANASNGSAYSVPKIAFTDLSVRAIQPPTTGQKIYWDKSVAGFGLRISQGGARSWIVLDPRAKRRLKETIGRYPLISLSEARTEAKMRLAEYTLGKMRPASISWATASKEFLEDIRFRVKTRTYADYRRLAKRFPFGETKLSDITARELERDLARINGRTERHHTFVILRVFCNWAHRKHYFDRNPIERMVPPPRYKDRERILTNEELIKVWKAAEDDTYSKIVKLLILTGQRRGEITNLTAAMIGAGTVTFPSWLTKNGRQHTIPVSTLTASLLASAKPAAPDELLFPVRSEKTGEPVAFSGWSKSKTAMDKRSGVTDWTLHDLRRTFRSKWAELRVSKEVAEKYINHVSGEHSGVKGIYDRYTYWTEMQEAAVKWEAHLQKLIESDTLPNRQLV
jgi:integrase